MVPFLLAALSEPPVPSDFFTTTAQVIPVLLVLLVVEERGGWIRGTESAPGLLGRTITITAAFWGETLALAALAFGSVPRFYWLFPYAAGGVGLLIACMMVPLAIVFVRRQWQAASRRTRFTAILLTVLGLLVAPTTAIVSFGGVGSPYVDAYLILLVSGIAWVVYQSSKGASPDEPAEPDEQPRQPGRPPRGG
ncbi:hypothetical protein [Nonomuraea sp. NPDC050691]|uniref:hypothetical protein n=1 Tax=Nonomuraea sp. NPDC050691 TaxID=3155661 RepID=UPI0033E272EF